MAKKKAWKQSKELQSTTSTSVASDQNQGTGASRRQAIIQAAGALAVTVVGGEIVKYLPGPATIVIPGPVKPGPTTSIGIFWGTPTPIENPGSATAADVPIKV